MFFGKVLSRFQKCVNQLLTCFAWLIVTPLPWVLFMRVMDRCKKVIAKSFDNVENEYMVIWEKIDGRCCKSLCMQQLVI
jgi:hypothetical protein